MNCCWVWKTVGKWGIRLGRSWIRSKHMDKLSIWLEMNGRIFEGAVSKSQIYLIVREMVNSTLMITWACEVWREEVYSLMTELRVLLIISILQRSERMWRVVVGMGFRVWTEEEAHLFLNSDYINRVWSNRKKKMRTCFDSEGCTRDIIEVNEYEIHHC